MTPRGLEQADVKCDISRDLGESSESSGAISGADKPISGDFDLPAGRQDPDLQQVIDAWSTLPETVRQDILAMVEASQARK